MLSLVKISKPNIGKYNLSALAAKFEYDDIANAILKSSGQEYLYFDRIKKVPAGVNKEEFWAMIKLQRRFSAKPIPPLNFNDRNFVMENLLPHHEAMFRLMNNRIKSSELHSEISYSAAIDNQKIKPLSAKKFLLEAVPPRDEGERLLKQAEFIYSEVLKQERLVILPGFDDAQERTEEMRYVYAPHGGNKICYIAPRNEIFRRELAKCLSFANDEFAAEFFHPVAKAVILHFWLLLLKPLAKNNGVLARAVQYWYLKKHSVELPVSRDIYDDLKGYSSSITYAVQDDNNFTYFLDYILKKLISAQEECIESKRRSIDFDRSILPGIQSRHDLNARQARLVYELIRVRNGRTNFSAYMKENNITRKTAADDLKGLEKSGYLKSVRTGKNIFYYAGEKAFGILSVL